MGERWQTETRLDKQFINVYYMFEQWRKTKIAFQTKYISPDCAMEAAAHAWQPWYLRMAAMGLLPHT